MDDFGDSLKRQLDGDQIEFVQSETDASQADKPKVIHPAVITKLWRFMTS